MREPLRHSSLSPSYMRHGTANREQKGKYHEKTANLQRDTVSGQSGSWLVGIPRVSADRAVRDLPALRAERLCRPGNPTRQPVATPTSVARILRTLSGLPADRPRPDREPRRSGSVLGGFPTGERSGDGEDPVLRGARGRDPHAPHFPARPRRRRSRSAAARSRSSTSSGSSPPGSSATSPSTPCKT